MFLHDFGPFIRRREGFGGLDPDGWVPLSRRKHDHLIQELIDPGQQVLSVLRLVCDVMKNLRAHRVDGCIRAEKSAVTLPAFSRQ